MNGSQFDDVDLGEGDWSDYDEKVSIQSDLLVAL